ncbi:MAG: hypothetical protein AAFQ21_16480, partial [Pseudomonadota bacterium]
MDTDVRQSMQNITASIGEIAGNLKAIADKGNTDMEALKELRQAFGQGLPILTSLRDIEKRLKLAIETSKL